MTLNGAIKQLQDLQNAEDVPFYYKPAIAEVINVLLMDAREVRHGHWIRIDDRDYWMCSCCKEENAYAYALNDDSLILQDKYCPVCGAEMIEE